MNFWQWFMLAAIAIPLCVIAERLSLLCKKLDAINQSLQQLKLK
jgi:hypothetical protein